MAGKGWKFWTRERLSAADLQGYIQDQVVMQFDSVSQRDTVLPASVSDGTVTYLEDLDDFQYREGGSGGWWRPLGARWPNQGTADGFPTDTGSGARYGEILWSWRYECPMVYTPNGWRQYAAAEVDSLTDYRNRLAGRGITSVAHGFRVVQTASRRQYVSIGGTINGGADFLLVSGVQDPARVTTGWPATPSGWVYNTPATYARSLGNGMAVVYCEVTRTGAAINPAANGDIATSQIGNIHVAFLPSETTPLCSGGAGRVATGIITSAGDISLCAVSNATDIGTGDVISLGGIFRMANLDG